MHKHVNTLNVTELDTDRIVSCYIYLHTHTRIHTHKEPTVQANLDSHVGKKGNLTSGRKATCRNRGAGTGKCLLWADVLLCGTDHRVMEPGQG